MSLEHALWTEKYRPSTLEDCALPARIKTIFRKIVKNKILDQHLLLEGVAGTGKTSAALAICHDIDADYIMINASLESQIDVLRTKITHFCSQTSLTGRRKVVILDEIDGAGETSKFQLSLRGMMEKFANNCSFILTCNNKGRLTDAIKSRCMVVSYTLSKSEKGEIISDIYKRMAFILAEEGVEFEGKVLAQMVNNCFPDTRNIINELQAYSSYGQIDAGILTAMSKTDIDVLIGYIKEKEYSSMVQWAAQNADQDFISIMIEIYRKIFDLMESSSVPEAVLVLNRYLDQATRAPSQEINFAAFATEYMMGCEWK